MAAASILTVDLGNSNGSAALVLADEGGRFAVDPIVSWSRGDSEVRAILGAGEAARMRARCARAAVSAVGSEDREAEAVQILTSLGFEVVARPEAGLAMRIDYPETCGSDRQYAARGALALAMGQWRRGEPPEGTGAHVIVVDAGTALTVDAARAVGGGGELEFLGGAIALGPGELQRAITGAGARLPEFGLEGPGGQRVPALGRSTMEALRSGVVVGFQGAVRELCTSIAEEAFGAAGGVRCYLTGGARAFARMALAESFGAELEEDALLDTAGPAEVEARLRLASSRTAEAVEDDTLIRAGSVVIDDAAYSAHVNGQPVNLTYKEYELLKFLAQHSGRVFTRAQLLKEVWGYDYYGGTRTVDVHVRRLRTKLGADHEHLITTVRNVGYSFTTTR